MADSEMTVEQKAAQRENNHEANIIRKAALGEIPWFSKEVLKPVGIAGVTGAAGVVVSRFFANKYFDGDSLPEDDADYDDMAKTKRGAFKVVVGLGGAKLLSKMSPAAAVGLAIGCVTDGVSDLLEDTVDDQLHSWFDAEGEDSRTTARRTTGPSSSSSTTTTTETPSAGMRSRRVY